MPSFGEGGSYSGHLRLRAQVDVGTVGASTTSVTVRLRVWVETDGWNFNDTQTVSFSGWKSGSATFLNNLSSGDKEVIDRSWSHPVGPGQTDRSFTARLSGNNATGSSPSVKINWHVDGSPVRPPAPPSQASMGVSRVGGTDWAPTHRVYWGYTTDNGGDAVDTWTLQIDDFDTFATPIAGANMDGGVREYITSTILPGGNYWFRVRGTNAGGTGDWKTQTYVAPSVVPQSPTLVAPAAITKTSATVDWTERDNGGNSVNRAQVEVRKVSDLSTVYSETVDGIATSRFVSGLDPGTTYDFRVRLGNDRGFSAFTDWSNNFTTDFSEPQNRPSLAVSVLTSTSARMAWSHTAGTGETTRTEFDYQVSTVSDFSSLFASGSVHASVLFKDIAGLTPATQYYFRVRAVNSIGDGPWSSPKSLTAPQGVKVRLGDAWVSKPLYVWDGSEWIVPTAINVRIGGVWVDAA